MVAESQRVVKIEIRNVSMVFGDDTDQPTLVLDDVSLQVRDGEFVTVVGPSGCGKSTLLNLLSGLIAPTSGHLFLDGKEVVGASKNYGYMLQRDLLLDWRTIQSNVTLGLEVRGMPKQEARALAQKYLKFYGLDGYEHKYPSELSGGMRQRAALARTMILNPNILLLDEPFVALDFQTKLVLESELAKSVAAGRRSVLFITHDVEEAVSLSDRVLVMSKRPGRIKAVHEIHLECDRTDPVSARNAPGFGDYVTTIWKQLEIQTSALDMEILKSLNLAEDIAS
ncbi:MAG: ABC transporter ATP-binding protein [Candidatus Binataceae bacterium]|nr:ABC transporter ATP-binding protein [Candidatus Binataceae bacterium]